MNAELKFSLPEESEDFELACKSGAMHSCISDILMELRKEYKYGQDGDRTAIFHEVSEMFWRKLEYHGLEDLF